MAIRVLAPLEEMPLLRKLVEPLCRDKGVLVPIGAVCIAARPARHHKNPVRDGATQPFSEFGRDGVHPLGAKQLAQRWRRAPGAAGRRVSTACLVRRRWDTSPWHHQ